MSLEKILFVFAAVAPAFCAFTNNVFAQSQVARGPLRTPGGTRGAPSTTDRLVDSDQTSNLNNFNFTGFAPGAVEFALVGDFFEIAPFGPLPEPSTWCAAAFAAAMIVFQLRHRGRAVIRKLIHRLTTLNAKPFQSQAKRGGLQEKRQLLETRL